MTPFLKGKNVHLCVLNSGDSDYYEWFNDAEVCAGNSHHVRPMTWNDVYDYLKTTEDLVLGIVIPTDRHIGNIALQNINPVYRSADLSIIIGDKAAWRKGYGKEAAAEATAEATAWAAACAAARDAQNKKLLEMLGETDD